MLPERDVSSPCFGILAGEPSGDMLGAGLMQALLARHPNARFVGVGGARMQALGLRSIVPIEQLSVHGFVQPLLRLPRLWWVFRAVRQQVLAARALTFIGVDFNVFNLLLERSLKRTGLRTVHYVSPSVYAWRRGRIGRIARSTDLLLALFPFEPALYQGAAVRVVYVGHPLADELVASPDRHSARAVLTAMGCRLSASADGLPNAARAPDRQPINDRRDATGPLIALLPGSRVSEVQLMGRLFVQAARIVRLTEPQAHFVVPCINARVRLLMQRVLDAADAHCWVELLDGQSRVAMMAADAVLVKSGTATLEALLLERPMVVAYTLGRVTAAIVRRLIRTPFVGLPNILAGRLAVPELLQENATPGKLAAALLQVLRDGNQAARELHPIAVSLRRGASQRGAQAVLELVGMA